MLTDIVKNCLNIHSRSMKEKMNIELDRDTANGWITRSLQYHYEKNYFNIMPSNVKVRMSEDDLRRKL